MAEQANGYPVWMLLRGDRFLYFGNDDCWYVGDNEARDANFDSNQGYIMHESLPGVPPTALGGDWQRGPEWDSDAMIIVSVEPSETSLPCDDSAYNADEGATESQCDNFILICGLFAAGHSAIDVRANLCPLECSIDELADTVVVSFPSKEFALKTLPGIQFELPGISCRYYNALELLELSTLQQGMDDVQTKNKAVVGKLTADEATNGSVKLESGGTLKTFIYRCEVCRAPFSCFADAETHEKACGG
jgi:hypothetical protein